VRAFPFLLCIFGCKKVEPAPTDVDGILHWTWSQYGDGTDEALAEGIRNAHDALDADHIDVLDGTTTSLTPEEAALVGWVDPDIASAQGLFVARSFACTLPALEALLTEQDQAAAYPDTFDSYDRTYTSDLDAYLARETAFVTWDAVYTSSLIGSSYTSHLVSGLRYVPVLDAEQSPHGPVILSRTVMVEPAIFEEGSGKSIDQNLQVEAFWEPDPGQIVHLYGMWEEATFGAGLDLSSEGVQRVVLNSMADWDDTTEANCATGMP